jgi:hypothetical protein
MASRIPEPMLRPGPLLSDRPSWVLEQGFLDSVCGLESASEFLIKEEAPYEV